MDLQLAEVIRLHGMWLNHEEGGVQADLSNKDLFGVNLIGADLDCINLSGADLRYANLRNASLRGADLTNTNFNQANLFDVDFRGSDLSGSRFRNADLREAYLGGTILSDADFCYADLRDAVGGPVFYSISWKGRESVGNIIEAVVQNGELVFSSNGLFCGGDVDDVRSSIERLEHEDKPYIVKAFETIVELEALRVSNEK